MLQRDAADWHNEGIGLHSSGDYEKAIRCFDHALEIDPGYAGAWYNKGYALAELTRYAESIQCYDHALKVDPKSRNVFHENGIRNLHW